MVEMPDSAMVMAAGLGKRMRPLTATMPKPLVRVGKGTLIDHALDHLAAAGVGRAIVNVHYLADALEAHLAKRKRPQVIISDERAQLLETGGGLVRARSLIDRPHFFCLNSDAMWSDGPVGALERLAREWREDAMDALLLLVPHARARHHGGRGDFHMDAEGRLGWRKAGRVAPYIFTGIQLLSDRLLDGAPEGPFSTRVLWDRAMQDGRLFGAVHDGLWYDVGTPAAIRPTAEHFA